MSSILRGIQKQTLKLIMIIFARNRCRRNVESHYALRPAEYNTHCYYSGYLLTDTAVGEKHWNHYCAHHQNASLGKAFLNGAEEWPIYPAFVPSVENEAGRIGTTWKEVYFSPAKVAVFKSHKCFWIKCCCVLLCHWLSWPFRDLPSAFCPSEALPSWSELL